MPLGIVVVVLVFVCLPNVPASRAAELEANGRTDIAHFGALPPEKMPNIWVFPQVWLCGSVAKMAAELAEVAGFMMSFNISAAEAYLTCRFSN